MQIINLNFFTITFYLIISIFIILVFFIFYKKHKKIDKDFPNIAKNKYFYIKYIFLILSFFVIFLSIFWIKIVDIWKNKINWVDIVFVLDVSKSMNVADISDEKNLYTRLDFSKMAISDFVIKNPENRYSLVIFSGEAISTIPLTNDTNVFLTLLQNVDYRNLTKQWSDFFEALNFANNRFENSQWRWKWVVFISDWADEDANLDLKSLYKKDIAYFVVWVGTKTWWKIIIWRDVFWDLKYQTYNWKYVISRLHEWNLEKISSILKWKYLKLSDFKALNIFSSDLKKLESKSIEINNSLNNKDFSRQLWFISFLFFILFLGTYLFLEKSR